ncbi:MAG: hypothetical protein Q9160_006166 [Pyrenula sp. 1 TL-2023]
MNKSQTVPWLERRSNIPRPISTATDFEDDDEEVFTNPDSLAGESQTTASTPDRALTPQSAGLHGFDFHFEEKSVKGPTGPHLFRSSAQYQDVDFILGSSPIEVPPVRDITTLNKAVAELDETQVQSWSPLEVANWMADSGFEDTVVDKFLSHDISGQILLDLQFEDLKELDITSFGKRHRLMSSIQALRDSVMLSSSPPPQAPAYDSPTQETMECRTPITPNAGEDSQSQSRRRRSRHRHTTSDDILPAESVSIVAIEQVFPKEHKCSKGEACHKWQKQQRKIQRMKDDLARDTQEQELANHRPKSESAPSTVASSDVLGQSKLPQIRLTEEVLNEVKPVDPQESVAQYLSFQHIRAPSMAKAPSPPPARSASVAPHCLPKATPALSQQLNSLPKLTIPVAETTNLGPYTPTVSAGARHRSKTPVSAVKRPIQSPSMQNSPYHYMSSAAPFSELEIPRYTTQTPLSEMDVPITAFHISDPLARETSQSVPPEMRYGAAGQETGLLSAPAFSHADPIERPASSSPRSQRGHQHVSYQRTRRPSFLTPTISRLSEADESLILEPQTAPVRLPEGCTHAGGMRKRKTTKLIRHEWNDGHFTLKGTRLAMFKDQEASLRDSRALECIDVDDYAVACSSLASSSKLSAAFKKSILGKNYNEDSMREQAFAFSLVPSREESKRTLIRGDGNKSHHFSVKTRDERIEWMRELMLAKAKSKGKREGGQFKLNGNFI